MKSKRTYKIIACVSIWLSVIIAFFSFAIAKSKAGVIIEQKYTYYNFDNFTSGYYFSDNLQYLATPSLTYIVFDIQFRNSNNTLKTISITNANQPTLQDIANTPRVRLNFSPNVATQNYYHVSIDYNELNNKYYILFDLQEIKDLLLEDVKTYYNDTTYYFLQFRISQSNIVSNEFKYATLSNIIAPTENIYDLQQNDVALIYLSDISGLSSSAYRDEITINWGYIDRTDNTLYAVYAPTIGAQRTDNNIISLEMPVNAAGDATSYYSIDQSAILSTISSGGATATAHIYGIYVWIQQSRIQWGLAEFDTSGLPASGASMNYITSLTSLYDYTVANTSTMTCRLSISNNFNFITIKNQPILSAYNINTVIQQGGFLPAWAVYNWARGSSAGYTSGEQAGAAPYQPGNTGYQEIFEAGRQAGIAENIGTVNWFVSAFEAVDAMLNIRIFPNITIGYLVGIPFVISVVWFIIRMFRGGGSSS